MIFVDLERKRGVLRKISALMLDPSIRLLLKYRIGVWLSGKKYKLPLVLARYVKFRMIRKSSCYISFKALLGKEIMFPHPIGVVIGDGVQIDDGVKIWQNVTIGSHGKPEVEKGYPVIKSDVKIYAGAIVVGSIVIGEGAVVGANSYVNKDVPPGATVVGSPAKPLRTN